MRMVSNMSSDWKVKNLVKLWKWADIWFWTPEMNLTHKKIHQQRVSHQNNGISRFWGNFWFRSNFFIFFSDWRCMPGMHLPKTEFLAVISKMAKLPQNVIFDIWWILPIFGTVTSCFSMENRLLANFPYWNPDFEMTPGELVLILRSAGL